MATYTATNDYTDPNLEELSIYGSDRLGLKKPNIDLEVNSKSGLDFVTLGGERDKTFELKDHLGNVLATVKDYKDLSTGVPVLLQTSSSFEGDDQELFEATYTTSTG